LAPGLLALMAAPVFAHHGTAGSYDENKVVFVVARDESGKEVTYAMEMGSPVTLVRLGYSRDTFKPGDQAEVEMHPSFTNPSNGYSPTSLKAVVNGKVMRTGKSE
jgi:hypothetical protein